MSGLGRNAAQIGRGMGQVAGGLVRVGQFATIAAIGAGVAAAKTSMEFEDAFANVRKTVEDTPAALDKIEQGLEDLSTQIPVTFRELTTIAAEAGALGVATKDIESFTEAVARTSAATIGLDPFMASEAFGKLSTIFTLTGDRIDATTGKVVSDYDRLGSALVALGNAGASSEADIIDVTKFFAGSGQAAGLSAAEVLAWGSAVSSLGVEPEGGGGALSRVFQRLTTNIATGSDKIKAWAKVSGVSVKEFTRLYKEDASDAVITFLEGLGKLDKFAGGAALKEAGIINQRDIRAILLLSQNLPVLTNQLGISTRAWDENTALMEVSEKRFDTLKAHIKEFTNTVSLGADAVGDGMTPAIGRLVEKAKAFLNLHMGDLETLGKDIGQAIDDIDWVKVNQGAQTAVDIAKSLLTIVSQIPPEILAGVAAFTVLNRLSGGLIGAGVGNIAGGLIGTVGTLARGALIAMLPPGLKQVVGAATALHVWVDNMPGGGLLGGSGAVVGGSRSLLGTVGSIAAKVFIVGAAVGVFSELLGALHAQSEENAAHAATLDTTMADFIAHGNVAAMEQSLRNLEALDREMNSGLTPENIAYQMNIDGVRSTLERQMTALRNEIDRYERGNRGAFGPPTPVGGGTFGGFGGSSPDERGELAVSGRGRVFSEAQLAQILGGGALPAARYGEMQGILDRGLAKGFKPTGAAVDATYQRNVLRQAEAQTTAINRVRDETARTTAAVTASQGQPISLYATINVPGVKSYAQTLNDVRHYGPMVPNQPRPNRRDE